jgi:hypothetical protein
MSTPRFLTVFVHGILRTHRFTRFYKPSLKPDWLAQMLRVSFLQSLNAALDSSLLKPSSQGQLELLQSLELLVTRLWLASREQALAKASALGWEEMLSQEQILSTRSRSLNMIPTQRASSLLEKWVVRQKKRQQSGSRITGGGHLTQSKSNTLS